MAERRRLSDIEESAEYSQKDSDAYYPGSEPGAADPVYTVDDAVEKIGFGAFQVVLTFLCGVIWFADATELMLLSILSFIVRCQWELSSAEEAAMTSVLFAGAVVGSILWGVVGDSIGRKKAMMGMVLVSFTSGILSAQKLTPGDDRIPGYPWLLFCRFGIGFASSCIPQVSTYYIEFLPRKARGVCSVLVSFWWTFGTVFSSGLAAIIMGKTDLGWHWFLGLSASPMLLAIILVPFMPESARFYVVKGEHEKARKVLAKIAWFNCKTLPVGRVVSHEMKYRNVEDKFKRGGLANEEPVHVLGSVNRSINSHYNVSGSEQQPLLVKASLHNKPKKIFNKISLFFVKGRWKVTVLLIPIWLGTVWLYYGNILLSTNILDNNPHCSSGNGTSHHTNGASNNSCESESFDEYLKVMWTAAAEVPGLIVAIVIIEVIGRKFTLTVNYVFLLVGLCLLFLCPSQALLAVILCWNRGVSDGIMRTMYVYTNEVYPTAIRGLGVGSFNCMSRIAAILTPYIAQVLFEISDYATIGVYAGFSLVLIVVCLLLPIETKGTMLKDER